MIIDVKKFFFINYQKNIQEDDYMIDNQGELDPVGEKIFFLSCEYETYLYYLFTSEQDNYVWFLDSAESVIWEKTNMTLLDYLKKYVFEKTKRNRFIDFDLTEEQINRSITGRLL